MKDFLEVVPPDDGTLSAAGAEESFRIEDSRDATTITLTVQNTGGDTSIGVIVEADSDQIKSFRMDKFLDHIHGCLKHLSVPDFVSEDLEIDIEQRKVIAQGCRVQLTPKEFELLRYLVANQGTSIEHSHLLKQVWGPAYGKEVEYLRVFINQLRRKIEPEPMNPRYIHTDRRFGYRFEHHRNGTK